MASLAGKVVAITGGASGIGRATAKILASHGVLLSIADVNQENLHEVEAELRKEAQQHGHGSDTVMSRVVDVRSSDACHAWIRDTVAHFQQPLAGAANMAGVMGRSLGEEAGSIRNITDEEFEWVVGVSMKGTLNSMRAELACMVEGAKGRNGGSIVNAASIAGLVGVLNNVPYVAAKHAVVGMTKTAAKEEGKRAIRVNAIAPGIVQTPMLDEINAIHGGETAGSIFGADVPGALARIGDASEAADVVVFLLSSQSSFVSGTVVPIEGGWVC
ncbi:putative secondary metabolism biosynthetic enzyme [Pestalotiopsis sp. 9143b]|nr:putative secondary metabolism biosynthetic enzyme [Pestalotiopsis sp. 9143b]